MTGSVGVLRSRARDAENDALAGVTGGRVGLAGVLTDLNRTAVPATVPGTVAAFAWDRKDSWSRRWWPQGITSSADATAGGTVDGRRVLVTSSYSKEIRRINKGARITVADVTDPSRVYYRHVLLVTAVLDDDGGVQLRPVRAHAGGLTWHGPHLHVAATHKGFLTFALDDIVAVPDTDQPDLLGRLPRGGMAGFGHRYVLPVRFVHRSRAEGTHAFRYSFLSLERSLSGHRLLAGEYARKDQSRRFLTYDLDPSTGLPTADDDGVSSATLLPGEGVERMQGAVRVGGRLHVTTSAGLHGRGSIWVGDPGSLLRFDRVLPPGPEDLCHWPAADQLWTQTEYPRQRLVLALDRSRFT
ncbi:MAG: hypothetical protein AVDCRST_MAG34-1161 [uncultured Nocardioidaceae bacterium]|uniref:Secreted protein n=1 Tax=uncultured Nocardioidaceae bacterium TaxID=253824 RepID=A0A6J4LY81_9ACTN|nr:MAG: hypothetical protein AVDCRST_MAG34-1161 [uncultured Nocardioidaceae bacterium]